MRNTIIAVAKKDLTQALRYPTWIIQIIIWPLIFPLIYIMSAVGFAGPDRSGMSAFKAATGTENYLGFIVIGTMVWMWVNTTMWGYGSYLREEQIRGTLESNWLCPIKRFYFLIGGSIVSLFSALIINIVSMVEYRFVYGIHFTGNIFSWILIFLIMIPGVYGVGTILAGLVLKLKEINAAVNVVRGIMMIICGITFPVSIMPMWMQGISKFIPYTYGIEAARQVMIKGEGISGAKFNIIMCLVEGLITLVIGRLVFRSIESQVRESGSLDRF